MSTTLSRRAALNLRAALMRCAQNGHIQTLLETLTPTSLENLYYDWEVWARKEQVPPPDPWSVWLFMGGRGAGKTRAGAEWIRGIVHGRYGFEAQPARRIALVGETHHDVLNVMVKGPSGIIAVCPQNERPKLEVTNRRLVFANGAVAEFYSAARPEALRGPQFDAAWCDEVGKWRHAQETWDMLQFGLRLGERPQVLATTTPRPTPLMRALLDDEAVIKATATTADNADNLAPDFLARMRGMFAGTQLAQQELDGRFVEEREDALWTADMLRQAYANKHPALGRIVVAVDPPVTAKETSDRCGIIVAGLGEDNKAYVLEDATMHRAKPLDWARRVASLYERYAADSIVVEVNQGGDLVSTVMRQVHDTLPIKPVHAKRSKHLRAEPVAALYAQGRVHHTGQSLADLEQEMMDFGTDGLSGGRSPDRLDALVWAITTLLLTGQDEPRVRPI